jgi:hypothetical protein
MAWFKLAMATVLGVAAFLKGTAAAPVAQLRVSRAASECGLVWAPVCCRNPGNGKGWTFPSMCDAQCDDSYCGCNTTATGGGHTLSDGFCGESFDRDTGGDLIEGGVGSGADDTELRVIPGYNFHAKNTMCKVDKASFFGPSGSGTHLEVCLGLCSSVADCNFVTYSRSGYCRFWYVRWYMCTIEGHSILVATG